MNNTIVHREIKTIDTHFYESYNNFCKAFSQFHNKNLTSLDLLAARLAFSKVARLVTHKHPEFLASKRHNLREKIAQAWVMNP